MPSPSSNRPLEEGGSNSLQRWRRRESNPGPQSRRKVASTSVAGDLISPSTSQPAGLSRASSLLVPGSEGANPHRASLLIDPGSPPQASDERDDFSYRLSSRVTEIETVRVRTYCFPGDLRGHPEPRLATTPTSRPRRSLSSPGA